LTRRSPKPPSLLGYALLGLLRNRPQSGYALRMHFSTTPMGRYSSSPGSIYPALKLLARSGWISRSEDNDGRPAFTLTRTGLAQLRAWLRQELDQSEFERAQEAFLLRFAFLDDENDQELSSRLLMEFAVLANARAKQLQAYARSREFRSLPPHARLAVGYGLQGSRLARSWAQRSLRAIRAQAGAGASG
jgi:DNA-binding PadR family transcriptional regulator